MIIQQVFHELQQNLQSIKKKLLGDFWKCSLPKETGVTTSSTGCEQTMGKESEPRGGR